MIKNEHSYDILKKVKDTVLEYDMFHAGDRLLVAVSGGPDSVALLHVLCDLKASYGLEIGVAHMNHGLRGDAADHDETFVRSLSRDMALPFYSVKKDVAIYGKKKKLSLEEAGRQLRYAFLGETAERENFHRVALGHTADDNAELVLMQLFRGSGTLGLGGIPPVRDERFVRPFIHVYKQELKAFLTGRRLPYVTDQSNGDDRFTRNRIRNRLIPMLQSSFNPNITATLNRFSAIVRCEEDWIEQTILPVFQGIVIDQTDTALKLDRSKLAALHPAVKRRVMRKAIGHVHGDLKRITLAHVDMTLDLCETDTSTGSIDLPHQVRVRRHRHILEIRKFSARLRDLPPGEEEAIAPFEYRVENALSIPEQLHIGELGVVIKFSKTKMEKETDLRYDKRQCQVAFIDMNSVTFPLIIRNIRPGDRFSPLGMTGSQKVKAFFINRKISGRDRRRGFVVACGERIIWLAGYRIDHSVRIVPNTKSVLKMELSLA